MQEKYLNNSVKAIIIERIEKGLRLKEIASNYSYLEIVTKYI